MARHNNIVPNAHFHKDWKRSVRTWFDQPAKKVKRRKARAVRAAKLYPRPIGLLRPVVRCQTIKYNTKIRGGRGFSLAELKAAGVRKKAARTIGIAVDKRRQNRNKDSFRRNVDRLKLYKSKLVVFPRKSSIKARKEKKKKAAEHKAAPTVQVLTKSVLPLPKSERRVKARVIAKEERKRLVTTVLHRAHMHAKNWGRAENKKTKKVRAPKASGGASAAAEDAD